MPKQTREVEHKIAPVFVTKIDAALGVVDAIVSVTGVRDQMDDVIDFGAYAKTITERGRKVRVLDAHNSWSVRDVIGVPLAMREIPREELPEELLTRFPDATGGLLTTTQYLMDTVEGAGAFARIRAGAIDEYSIGFQTIRSEMRQVPGPDGKPLYVRYIKEIKLWEYSPVVWGANPATVTVGVKSDAPADMENRAGRVLSAANATAILDAWQKLGEVLSAAGITPETLDEDLTMEEDEGSKTLVGPDLPQGETPPTAPAPEPLTGTLEQRRDLLQKRIAQFDTGGGGL